MENNKPTTIIRAEFISSLKDLINSTKLPPFILEPIFKDIYNDIRIMAQMQLEADIKNYKQQSLEQDIEE